MIKLLNVTPTKPHVLELSFSDHTQGVFDGAAYLATRQGPLLEALRARLLQPLLCGCRCLVLAQWAGAFCRLAA